MKAAQNPAPSPDAPSVAVGGLRVALCGSFRRQTDLLRADYEALVQTGCIVLSPLDPDFVEEREGFVYARGERDLPAERIEAAHLDSMQRADMVWLHAPDGYVGRSGAMELGFAHAHGLRVYSRNRPTEPGFRGLVEVVSGPEEVVTALVPGMREAPSRALAALQDYYRRIAQLRGYDREDLRDCMLLLTEEVGELAHAVRKQVGLVRESGYADGTAITTELADVQLYLVHLANTLEIDLAAAVAEKERTNAARWLTRTERRAA